MNLFKICIILLTIADLFTLISGCCAKLSCITYSIKLYPQTKVNKRLCCISHFTVLNRGKVAHSHSNLDLEHAKIFLTTDTKHIGRNEKESGLRIRQRIAYLHSTGIKLPLKIQIGIYIKLSCDHSEHN